MRNGVLSGLLVLAACSCGEPRPGAPGRAPGPSPAAVSFRPGLAPLAGLVGAWTADARDPGTGRRFTLRYQVTPSLDGAWLDGVGDAAELGLRIHDRWGIDGPTGDIVRVLFDSSGLWAVVRSRGWDGDVLVLTGEARVAGGGFSIRETLTRVGPAELHAVWEAERDGVWTPYSVERLTRDP